VVLQRVGSGLEGRPSADPELAGLVSGSDAPCDGEIIGEEVPAPRPVVTKGRSREPEINTWDVPAAKVATVDSTGAGDAFVGALAAALAEGRPLSQAVRRAVAGGGLATTRSGAREGMPTSAELEEFIAAS